MSNYKNAVCRGCWQLGNNCGKCERCIETKPVNDTKIKRIADTKEECIIMNRSEAANICNEYAEILRRESHHNHEIVKVNGVVRWKENEVINGILLDVSLNYLCPLLDQLGYGKNSEVYRKLYRDMGYSLSGYWEIFYWKCNNDEADLYIAKKQ